MEPIKSEAEIIGRMVRFTATDGHSFNARRVQGLMRVSRVLLKESEFMVCGQAILGDSIGAFLAGIDFKPEFWRGWAKLQDCEFPAEMEIKVFAEQLGLKMKNFFLPELEIDFQCSAKSLVQESAQTI